LLQTNKASPGGHRAIARGANADLGYRRVSRFIVLIDDSGESSARSGSGHSQALMNEVSLGAEILVG
jgi:hypothetical protein